MAEGEKFNWRLTAVWWIVLFAGAMYLMLLTAINKTIVIADSSLEEGEQGADNVALVQELALIETKVEKGVLSIPLEEGTKAGNLVVENSYLDKELRIFIGGADAQFYETHAVQGDLSSVLKAECKVQNSGVLICLYSDGVYEFQTSMDGASLKIQANKPKDLYSMVVVVDPAECGQQTAMEGEEAPEELTLAVCRLLAQQWDMEGVKLYFTRAQDRTMTSEECVAFAEDVGADIYIRLDTAQDEDTTQYGIRSRYNEAYFIPEFGNVELADILTRNVTIASGNRAVGLLPTEDNNILNNIQIPASSIELGYISNVQESGLLAQESYRQKLADGIEAAIREVYTNYYEQNIQ